MTEQNQENQGKSEEFSQEGNTQQPYTPTPQPQPQPEQPIYQGQPNYGQQPNYGGIPPQDIPNNYLAMNIVATVVGFLTCGMCCIAGIVGIVGIVFSNQVKTKYFSGDMNGALNSAQTAKMLGIVSLVLTGLSLLANLAWILFGGMSSYMEILQQIQENSGRY